MNRDFQENEVIPLSHETHLPDILYFYNFSCHILTKCIIQQNVSYHDIHFAKGWYPVLTGLAIVTIHIFFPSWPDMILACYNRFKNATTYIVNYC